MRAPFKKVIIWGHPLHSNTFSYVHSAFYKAFKHLGYDTYWLDNTPENSISMDFNGCLFLTENQVDSHIPLVKSSKYVLHNCDQVKYVDASVDFMMLQTYTHDVIGRDDRIDTYTYISPDGRCLYQPWATDLLPDEIDSNIVSRGSVARDKVVYWVGTIGDGLFGNRSEIAGFVKACSENGISFCQKTSVSNQEHSECIKLSYLAPQISGTWQLENGYIPCRIFKNISYGQYGITNSEAVNNIFDSRLIFNADSYQLFHSAEEHKGEQALIGLMEMVRDKHTYLNRIDRILSALP